MGVGSAVTRFGLLLSHMRASETQSAVHGSALSVWSGVAIVFPGSSCSHCNALQADWLETNPLAEAIGALLPRMRTIGQAATTESDLVTSLRVALLTKASKRLIVCTSLQKQR